MLSARLRITGTGGAPAALAETATGTDGAAVTEHGAVVTEPAPGFAALAGTGGAAVTETAPVAAPAPAAAVTRHPNRKAGQLPCCVKETGVVG